MFHAHSASTVILGRGERERDGGFTPGLSVKETGGGGGGGFDSSGGGGAALRRRVERKAD